MVRVCFLSLRFFSLFLFLLVAWHLLRSIENSNTLAKQLGESLERCLKQRSELLSNFRTLFLSGLLRNLPEGRKAFLEQHFSDIQAVRAFFELYSHGQLGPKLPYHIDELEGLISMINEETGEWQPGTCPSSPMLSLPAASRHETPEAGDEGPSGSNAGPQCSRRSNVENYGEDDLRFLKQLNITPKGSSSSDDSEEAELEEDSE